MTNKELFNFKFEYLNSGELRNKQTGKIAGGLTSEGYIRVRINGREYRAHRIVWEMFNGNIEEGLVIDHINGNRQDNRIENLRLATRLENGSNRLGNSRELPKGVSVTPSGKFRARIKYKGITECLGTYATAELASIAYSLRADELQGKFSLNNSRDISTLS